MDIHATIASAGTGYALRGLQGRIIDLLGRDIIGGRYAPGELLPNESALISRHGVSRTSLREAVKVLAAKGLVETRQRVGTRVRPRELWNVFDTDILRWQHHDGIREAALHDLVELRQIVEPQAASMAASRANADDLRRIERALDEMMGNTHDLDAFAAGDVAFHLAIFAATHNALLQGFGQLIADFLLLCFTTPVPSERSGERSFDFKKGARIHGLVFDAIKRGNADDAASAMLAVIVRGRHELILSTRSPSSDVAVA